MKKFKRKFLYKDVKSIEATIIKIKKGRDELNRFVEKVEQELKEPLSNKEKVDLKELGTDFLARKLRSKFIFKDASEEFNLQAIGINLKSLTEYYKLNCGHWKKYSYQIQSGKFECLNIEDSPEVQKHIHYTQNQKQNDALFMAQKISEIFETVMDKGYLRVRQIENIPSVTDLVEVLSYNSINYSRGSKPKIQPNLRYIKNLE